MVPLAAALALLAVLLTSAVIWLGLFGGKGVSDQD